MADLHELHLSYESNLTDLLRMNYVSFYNLVWTEDKNTPLDGSSASSIFMGTHINPAATNMLSEAFSWECMFTETLPRNGISLVVV
jgi:hypothetical protein